MQCQQYIQFWVGRPNTGSGRPWILQISHFHQRSTLLGGDTNNFLLTEREIKTDPSCETAIFHKLLTVAAAGQREVRPNPAIACTQHTVYCIALDRYVYRFVCDLQSLLGYTPEELHAMVDLQPLVKKEDDH